MTSTRPFLPALTLALLVGTAGSAPAQVLGAFRWQLQPYCNVVTLVVTQVGGVFRLEGTDDRCGAATQSSAVGTAFVNPDGSIGLGLTVVTGPGGVAFPVDATVTLPSASGTWRDALGHSGSFVLTPGSGTGGSPRPLTGAGGSVTVSAIRSGVGVVAAPIAPGSTEVAVGVDFGGTGASSQVARADHTHEGPGVASTHVGALAMPISTGHDNTAMGLLALNGNTTGSYNTSTGSRSLMANTNGSSNTAFGALALVANTTGGFNTALGVSALQTNTSGVENTAIGARSLLSSTGSRLTAVGYRALAGSQSSSDNTAVGHSSLSVNSAGARNTAVGASSMVANTTGVNNAAFGWQALMNSIDGSANTAVGAFALESAGTAGATHSNNVGVGSQAGARLVSGMNNAFLGTQSGINLSSGTGNVLIGTSAGVGLTSGSYNIHIGSLGPAAPSGESNTIRIGQVGTQTSTYVAGVFGATASGGVTVVVNASGKLGTTTSSARYKEQVTSVTASVSPRLQALRPVRFVYTPAFDDGSRLPQYGLIAEEVADVFPELAVRDAEGRPETVRYHFLPPLLLAEVQRLERERAALAAEIAALRDELAALRTSLQRGIGATRR